MDDEDEFFYAVKTGDVSTVRRFYDRMKSRTLMQIVIAMAAEFDQVEVMRVIADMQGPRCLSDVNGVSKTPLHYACEAGSAAAIEFLLSHEKVDVNDKSDDTTPLDSLLWCRMDDANTPKLVAMLMRAGAKMSYVLESYKNKKPWETARRIYFGIALASARTPRLGKNSPLRNLPEDLIHKLCRTAF